MSELTLFLVRVAYLAILWIFVLSAISVIRSDMFGARVPSAPGTAPPPKPTKPTKPTKQKAPPKRRGSPTHVAVIQGQNAGATANLAEAPILIGRGNDAAIRLDDELRQKYADVGLPAGPFKSVGFYSPPTPDDLTGKPHVAGRTSGVEPFWWTLTEFCSGELLPYVFTDAEDERNQYTMVVSQVAARLRLDAMEAGKDGAVSIDGDTCRTYEQLVDVIDGVADPGQRGLSSRAPLLAEERRLLATFVGGEEVLGAGLARAALRTARVIDVRLVQVESGIAALEDQLNNLRRRDKAVTGVAGEARQAARREEEAVALGETMEAWLARASLP